MSSTRTAKPVARAARPAQAGARTSRPRAGPWHEGFLPFFEASPDLLCIAGFDGLFKRVNRAWPQALGWSVRELQSRPFVRFVHPDDRPATLAETAKLAAGAMTINFENRYRCKDGSYKWLQWTARSLADQRVICAIARDVTEQRRLEQEILTTLDRERGRVGRELHDGVCQDLAGIAALSAALARKLALAPAREPSAAREISKLLRQTIRHVRDLARGFDPLGLDETGFETGLAAFCRNTEVRFKIRCSLHCAPRAPEPGAERGIHLYRIVQEAVGNAIAHGRAQRIEVHLGFHHGRGTLAIQDDGTGLPRGPAVRPGIGLRTMEYRARLIGATLELQRRSPRGTVVTCVFPCPPPKRKA